MIIEELLKIGLSSWEERVAAAMYLEHMALAEGMFGAEVLMRLGQALTVLRELPEMWARELSLQVVLSERC